MAIYYRDVKSMSRYRHLCLYQCEPHLLHLRHQGSQLHASQPSLAVCFWGAARCDTACSSSLVAADAALSSLRRGTSEAALTAGTNLILGTGPYISALAT